MKDKRWARHHSAETNVKNVKETRAVNSCENIRTADKLQRTAGWFQTLEGGMDHLRAVIIDDVLGIADELDEDMARHVESYRCEWTETLADPDRRSQFVEFVNAPETNSTPGWITDRGQRMPAPALVPGGVS